MEEYRQSPSRGYTYYGGMKNFFMVSRHYGLVSYIKDYLSVNDRMRLIKVNKNFLKSVTSDPDIDVRLTFLNF
jgi:hypothetical protein